MQEECYANAQNFEQTVNVLHQNVMVQVANQEEVLKVDRLRFEDMVNVEADRYQQAIVAEQRLREDALSSTQRWGTEAHRAQVAYDESLRRATEASQSVAIKANALMEANREMEEMRFEQSRLRRELEARLAEYSSSRPESRILQTYR